MPGNSATPHALATRMRAQLLHALVRLGETKQTEQTIAAMDTRERESGAVHTALAALRLAQDNPEAAKTALAPVLDDATADANPTWVLAQACLLEARARDALGDAGAAERALERALDLTEPDDGLLLPFLFHPTPGLLERHSRFRTTHGSLISEILNLLAGKSYARTLGEPARMLEALSDSELRVLRYLPTNLSNQETPAKLYVSVNTVKAHIRHLYAKLDAHRRGEAVEAELAHSACSPLPRADPEPQTATSRREDRQRGKESEGVRPPPRPTPPARSDRRGWRPIPRAKAQFPLAARERKCADMPIATAKHERAAPLSCLTTRHTDGADESTGAPARRRRQARE